MYNRSLYSGLEWYVISSTAHFGMCVPPWEYVCLSLKAKIVATFFVFFSMRKVERKKAGVCGAGLKINICGRHVWLGDTYIRVERERVWLSHLCCIAHKTKNAVRTVTSNIIETGIWSKSALKMPLGHSTLCARSLAPRSALKPPNDTPRPEELKPCHDKVSCVVG